MVNIKLRNGYLATRNRVNVLEESAAVGSQSEQISPP